jgi:TetR/AcrR family acrAB operon transcriptional repressor
MARVSTDSRRRIDEIGEESRRRILDAAEDLFSTRGFERTSFVDIAERSGISRGSIPWHFKNKHGLLIAVVERAMDSFLGQERYETIPSLRGILDDYAEWADDGKSTLMFMLTTEAMGSSGAVREHYQAFFEQHRRGIRRWLRAQRPEGVDADRAAERERGFALTMNAAVTGMHLQATIDPDAVQMKAALDALEDTFATRLSALWDGISATES